MQRLKTSISGSGCCRIFLQIVKRWETNDPALLVIRLAEPIDFEALDGLTSQNPAKKFVWNPGIEMQACFGRRNRRQPKMSKIEAIAAECEEDDY